MEQQYPGTWYGTWTFPPGAVAIVKEVLPDGSASVSFLSCPAESFQVLHDELPAFMRLEDEGSLGLVSELLASYIAGGEAGVGPGFGDVEAADLVAALGRVVDDSEDLQRNLIEAGGIETLMMLVKTGDSRLQAEALGLLRSFAVDASLCGEIAGESDAISVVAKLLRTGDNDVQIEAAGLLLNFAYKNLQLQERIAELGAIPPLVLLLTAGGTEAQRNAAGALRNLAYRSPRNKKAIEEAGGLRALVRVLIAGCGAEVDAEVAGAIMSLTDGCATNAMFVGEAGGLLPLVRLLDGRCGDKAQALAAGALRNLAANAQIRAAIAEVGGIVPLMKLATASDVKEEAKAAAVGALVNLWYRSAHNRAAITSASGVALGMGRSASAPAVVSLAFMGDATASAQFELPTNPKQAFLVTGEEAIPCAASYPSLDEDLGGSISPITSSGGLATLLYSLLRQPAKHSRNVEFAPEDEVVVVHLP
mmetsp:Transcript_87311/g.282139  ORF Transcript_87311/g.282139 Transcript_87311/m.282139 type:complete len:477 (-) Transcript_87311:215-1645(-)